MDVCNPCFVATYFLVETNFSMYGARCTGSELSLSDCDDYYYRDCRADEGAGVSCEYEPPSDTIVELVGGNTTAGNILVDGRPIWWVSVIRKDFKDLI